MEEYEYALLHSEYTTVVSVPVPIAYMAIQYQSECVLSIGATIPKGKNKSALEAVLRAFYGQFNDYELNIKLI